MHTIETQTLNGHRTAACNYHRLHSNSARHQPELQEVMP